MELLRLVALERGTHIDDRQLRTLAETVAGPVPQLLRALREWELAAKVGSNPAATRSGITAKDIVAVVARYFGDDTGSFAWPRLVANHWSLPAALPCICFARSRGASYAQIGKELGHRDHSTIMHAMESLQLALATDATTQHAVEELRRILLAV